MVTFGDIRSQIRARQTDISQSRGIISQRRAEIAAARAEGQEILTELKKPELKIRTQQFAIRDDPSLFARERQLKKQRLLRISAKQRGIVQIETQLGDIKKAETELNIAERQILEQEGILSQQETRISRLAQDPDIQIRRLDGGFEFFKISRGRIPPKPGILPEAPIPRKIGIIEPVDPEQLKLKAGLLRQLVKEGKLSPGTFITILDPKIKIVTSTLEQEIIKQNPQLRFLLQFTEPRKKTQLKKAVSVFVKKQLLVTRAPILGKVIMPTAQTEIQKASEKAFGGLTQKEKEEFGAKFTKFEEIPIEKRKEFLGFGLFFKRLPKEEQEAQITEFIGLIEKGIVPVPKEERVTIIAAAAAAAFPGSTNPLIGALVSKEKREELAKRKRERARIYLTELEPGRKIFKTLPFGERIALTGVETFATAVTLPITLPQLGVKILTGKGDILQRIQTGKTIFLPDVQKEYLAQLRLEPGQTGGIGLLIGGVQTAVTGEEAEEIRFAREFPIEAAFGTVSEVIGLVLGFKAVKVGVKAVKKRVAIGIIKAPTISAKFQTFIEASKRPISVELGKKVGLFTERLSGTTFARRIFDVSAGTRVPAKVLTIVEKKGARIRITERIPGEIKGVPVTTEIKGTLKLFKQRFKDIGRREVVPPEIVARAKPGKFIDVKGLFRGGERIQVSLAKTVSRAKGIFRKRIVIKEVGRREVEPLFKKSFLVTTKPATLPGFIRGPGEIELQKIIAAGEKLPPSVLQLPPAVKTGFLEFGVKPTRLFTFKFLRKSFKSFDEFLRSQEAGGALVLAPRPVTTVTGRAGAGIFIRDVTAGRVLALPVSEITFGKALSLSAISKAFVSVTQPKEIQIQKIGVDQQVSFIQTEKQIRIQQAQQEKIFKQIQDQLRLPITKEERLSVSITGREEILAQITGQEVLQVQLQEQKQIQLQQQEQLLKGVIETKLIKIPIPGRAKAIGRIFPVAPFMIEPGIMFGIGEERQRGFNVLVKERQFVKGKRIAPGKFEVLSKRALSEQDAITLALNAADQSRVRTVRIVPTDKPAQKLNIRGLTPGQFLFNKFTQRGNIFVESTQFAIDSPGEVADISARGWYAKQPRRIRMAREAREMEMPIMDLFADMNKQLRRMGFGF